jgi:hypothetical protein
MRGFWAYAIAGATSASATAQDAAKGIRSDVMAASLQRRAC